jgi:hypothetical protein
LIFDRFREEGFGGSDVALGAEPEIDNQTSFAQVRLPFAATEFYTGTFV